MQSEKEIREKQKEYKNNFAYFVKERNKYLISLPVEKLLEEVGWYD